MASLYNTKISETYPGLIKTLDTTAITATLKQLSDGNGNATGLFVNTAGDFKVTAILEWGSLKDTGTGITISKFVSESDGIANNDNDTTIPTSGAVIDYVQGQVTLVDLDFLGDSNTGTPAVDLDSQSFRVLGTTNQITTSGADQTLTLSLPPTVHRNLEGNVTGNLTGDVTGNVTGNVTGDLTGDSAGTHTGAVVGNLTGNVTGDLTGTVTATSVLADGVSGTTQTVSDDSTKVATTAFVQDALSTVPAGLVFQGTWNADTNTPTLATGVGTTGHFYIVSVAGSTDLDGITDWQVGDWAVFVEQGATDQWEKVDNSSVLDGTGTGGKISKWAGSGDSVTLTNSIITESGSNIGIGMTPSKLLDIQATDNLALRYYNSTSFKAGIEVATTDGDMIASSVINDLAIRSQSNILFATGGNIEKMRISSAGALQLNEYGAGTLVSDASGNITVSSGGGEGGPYLPLAGGTLTGALTGTSATFAGALTVTNQNINLSNAYNLTGRNVANTLFIGLIGRGTDDKVKIDSDGYGTTFGGSITGTAATFAGNVNVTGDASNGGTINIGDTAAYRGILSYSGASTTTLSIANSYDTATSRIDFNLRTSGTPITALRLEGSGNATFSGNVGIGGTPSEQFEVFNDSASAVIMAKSSASTGDAYLILNASGTGAGRQSKIFFGDSADLDVGAIDYLHDSDSMQIRTAATTALTIDTSQNSTFAGNVTTASPLTINAQEYVIRIDQSDSEKFQIRNVTSGVNSLIIDTSSNATFAGSITANTTSTPTLIVGRDGTDGDAVQVYNGATGSTKALALGVSGNDGTIYSQYGDIILQPSAGLVGIGISTPSAPLSIQAATNARAIRLLGRSADEISEVDFYKNDNSTILARLESLSTSFNINTYPSNPITFKTANVERMRIDSAGTVQVRNSSIPTIQLYNTDTSLGIAQTLGDIDFYQSDPSGTGVGVVSKIRSINDSSFQGEAGLSFHTGTTTGLAERMRIDSAGNVGIGETSPSYKLDVHNGTAGEGIARFSGAGSDDMLIVTESGYMAIDTRNTTSGLSFQIQGTDKVRIDSAGNVGIGTTAPEQMLEVNSSAHPTIVVSSATDDCSIAFKKGTGATPTWRVGRDASNSDALTFAYNATGYPSLTGNSLVSIDTSGNVGIGQSPVSGARLTLGTGNVANEILSFASTTGGNAELRNTSSTGTFTFTNANGASERMRITSAGNVLIGTTGTPNGTSVYGSGFIPVSTGKVALRMASSSTSAGTLIEFFNPNGSVGNITISASATTYNTSSDYRLKENVVGMTGALDRVAQLKPSRFNFIADSDKVVDGFLAHEVQEVVPEAITGTKDAMKDEEYEVTPAVYEDVVHDAIEEVTDEEGNVITEAKESWTENVLVTEAVMGTRSVEDYQGIDQSKLVPLLVGAIQELRAEIELLKSK